MNKQYEIYNLQYYENIIARDSNVPYTDAAFWSGNFAKIAQKIVDTFQPKTVLDAGCALGYLVAALRDLGVEAYGVDISEYAISHVREDIRMYCAVGSLSKPLPASLPQNYDLVVTIEVLEHLSAEDGAAAIRNLCQLSDRVLFSSTPDDFDDVTHINVQQREYWSVLFAREKFYDDIFCRPTWISPQAVLYRKNRDILDVISAYERSIRLNDRRDKIGEAVYTGRVYFDFGQGESEDACHRFTFQSGDWVRQRIAVPEGCRSVRFDPVEGFGCLVRGFRIRSDSVLLEIEKTNAIAQDDLLLFQTIDPQIIIGKMPEDIHWIDVEAEICPMGSTAWLKLYHEMQCLQHQAEEAEALRQLAREQDDQIAQLEEKVASHWKQITDYSNLVAYERAEAKKVSDALLAIQGSACWRMTKPLRVVLDLIKTVLRTLHSYGLKTTLRKVWNKLRRRQEAAPAAPMVQALPVSPETNRITGHPVDPIQTILVDEPVRRLNLVTDSIGSDSLLGGVATALIVATEFANRNDYELRIITRNTETNPLNYENMIRISGIEPAKRVSFYSDHDRFTRSIDFKLEISPQDIFFATSWWSAKAIEGTSLRKRFFYIIQEVETFFYNYGGERMLCEQVMRSPDIDFIVNSGFLYQYFREHDPNIAAQGCCFEPAFPAALYRKKEFAAKKRYKLFFYARPNNPRNLYGVGVERLKKAVERGIVDTDEWDIYCAGQNAPVITFCNGTQSVNLGQLSWTEYAKFLADVDLGLCLMYTPHPSYPPFDVACSGGVVLSNQMMNKKTFDMCANVILADLEEEAFLEAFKDAVALAKNTAQRKKNYEESTIPRNWPDTLEETMAFMKGKCDDV